MTIDQKLQAISARAEKLNKATDDLNQTINGIEAKLAAVRVGVSVWLDSLLDEKRSFEEVEAPNGEYRTARMRSGWNLGYTKIEDAWRIAAKRCEGEDFNGDCELTDSAGAVPLVTAPRAVRMQAAEQLETLLDAILNRMSEYMRGIESAGAVMTDKASPTAIAAEIKAAHEDARANVRRAVGKETR